ncbi:unnamed protein product [Cochlearia groenlandica]
MAKKVFCVEAFEIFPWGRVEFESLIGSIKVVEREGCDNLVPILRWAGSRKRLDDLKLIKEEVENHGKVPAKGNAEMPSNNELVILGLNATIKACMEKVDVVQRKHDALEKELREKIQSLEEEVNELKGKKTSPEQEASVEDANATLNKDAEEDDCGNSNTSWTATTKVVAEGNERIRCAVTKKSIKKEKVDVVDEMVDMTGRRGDKTPSVSVEIWYDPIQREKFKRLGVALNAMVTGIGIQGVNEDKLKRKPHMAQSQLSPFISNSEMKRVISGPAPSPLAYDPFAPVDKRLIDNLEAFLKIDEIEPFNTFDSRAEFYRIIVAPRKEWRTDDYDKDILEACRVFTRMIPTMLNEVVPPNLRRKSNKQFKVVRLKSVPQNINHHDCGVFAIKYLECLALGWSFEGLDDRNIMAITWRLAAELFDLEMRPQVACTNPLSRGDFDDHVPLMTSSLPELLP